MLKYVSHIAMVVSLGAILYIMARVLPRVDDTVTGGLTFKTDWVIRRIEAADRVLRLFLEKFLRRLGVILMKMQNAAHRKLARIRRDRAKEADFQAAGGNLFPADPAPADQAEGANKSEGTDGGVANRARL